jgi:hypothetical protein
MDSESVKQPLLVWVYHCIIVVTQVREYAMDTACFIIHTDLLSESQQNLPSILCFSISRRE